MHHRGWSFLVLCRSPMTIFSVVKKIFVIFAHLSRVPKKARQPEIIFPIPHPDAITTATFGALGRMHALPN